MKILVTGGAGFIGSHLVEGLLESGHEVKVLDNLSTGNIENLSECEGKSSFQFIKGDIRDRVDVESAVRGVDVIFHEAAITSVPVSVDNPELTREVNVEGTLKLLQEALDQCVDRFVFASSCAVYGEVDDLPINEESSLDPLSPYAESKLKGEEKCKEFDQKGLETVMLRYFNVYGPRQGEGSYSGVITKFFDRVEKGEAPIIFGSGKQTRDFVYVRDIVRANILAMKKKDISGEVFNVGGGVSVSINELCRTILDITGNSEMDPIYEEARPGDIMHSRADLSKSSEMLDYESEVSIEEGLREVSEEYEF